LEIVARLDDLNFEWDSAKAESNLKKHGVDFFDAMMSSSIPWLAF
jgi:uncharacterized DUF497 family protein